MNDFNTKKLYSDIIFAMESLNGFVSKETLNRRKYIRYLNIVKECSENKDKINFKNNKEILAQLSNCQKCKCFNCDKECSAEGCNRCEPGGMVSQCDNKIATVYHFSDKTFQLKSNKLRSSATYKVLAIIEDIEYKEFFVVLSLGKKKYISYYYSEIGGDTFSEIKDIEDFNFAIKVFENSEVSMRG
ncbi:hypothetical protein [Clostridium vincentii]|uniref:DUF1292 domain-containing protein n=1 Tax=Clostridium vincentii TaxID=52704 RepID=A0A2T0BFG3_9CLOT|nr:hypothetical protein [Clostridium vincentii]PRR82619.1 hypothetical protein CLVI_15860 [Clostridium vincentii]